MRAVRTRAHACVRSLTERYCRSTSAITKTCPTRYAAYPPRMWSIPWVIFLLPLISAQPSKLVFTYTLMRHGARNLLPKSHYLKDGHMETALIPLGQRQCFSAGENWRSRYLDPVGCLALRGAIGEPDNTCLFPSFPLPLMVRYGVRLDPSVSFSLYNTKAISSQVDRTLASARSFLGGVFPPIPALVNSTPQAPFLAAAGSAALSNGLYLPDGEQIVPIFAAAGGDADDILVRAYNKCPAYERRLSDWYQTEEFAAKVAETTPLREYINSLMRGWVFSNGLNNDTSLINWYNVYDAFNVYYTSGYGNPMPPVNSTILSQIVALAHWLETKKSASELAGNLLGGQILADLSLDLFAAVRDIRAGLANLRLKLVSGHYNTQLGVLAALRLDKFLPASKMPWLSSMPSTAAVLVFELHQSTADANLFAVRAVIQNGAMRNYTAVPLPCSSEAGARVAGAHACALDSFIALLAPAVQEVGTAASWCSACAATAPLLCMVTALKSAATGMNTPAMDTPYSDTLVAAIVLLSVCLCGALYFLYRAHRKNVRYGTNEDAGLVALSSASRIS